MSVVLTPGSAPGQSPSGISSTWQAGYPFAPLLNPSATQTANGPTPQAAGNTGASTAAPADKVVKAYLHSSGKHDASTIQGAFSQPSAFSAVTLAPVREQPEDPALIMRASGASKQTVNKVLEVTLAVNAAMLVGFVLMPLIELNRDWARNGEHIYGHKDMVDVQKLAQRDAYAEVDARHQATLQRQDRTNATALKRVDALESEAASLIKRAPPLENVYEGDALGSTRNLQDKLRKALFATNKATAKEQAQREYIQKLFGDIRKKGGVGAIDGATLPISSANDADPFSKAKLDGTGFDEKTIGELRKYAALAEKELQKYDNFPKKIHDVQRGVNESPSDYSFFTKGAILLMKDEKLVDKTQKSDVLIIDHAPPKGFNNGKPLAYFFKGGLPRTKYGENRLWTAIARQRAILTYAAQAGAIDDARKIVIDAGLGKLAVGTSQPEVVERLQNALAYDEATLRERGWNGEVPATAPVHEWGAMADHEQGYPMQLNGSAHKRRWGRFLGRHKLYWKGMATTMNRPEEASQKGGRTLWASFPATLAVGGVVAGLAIIGALIAQHHQKEQSTESLSA